MNEADEIKREQETAQRFMQRAMHFAMEVLGEGSKITPVSLVERWASETPNAKAILSPDGEYNYKEFSSISNRVANVLASRGAKAGEAVALMMDSRPEFLFSVIGAAKLGAATGLINTNLVGDQLKHALKITKSEYVIVGGEHADAIKAIANEIDIAPERILVWGGEAFKGSSSMDEALKNASDAPVDPALSADIKAPFVYICTSGTTGLPKAAMVPCQRWLQGAYYYGQTVLEAGPNDVMYTCGLPLYHNVAISNGWGIALSGGGAVAIRRRFSASAFWEDVEKYRCTMFTYVGEVCRYLIKSDKHPKETTHSLRCILGAGLRPDIWDEFLTRFNIPAVYEYYGATEGNVGLINLTGRPGMVGQISPDRGHVLAKVDPETEEMVEEDGKLVAAKPGESGILIARIGPMANFEGYVDKTKNAAKVIDNPFGKGDRYFNSGDLLTLHERNWVSFADRLGDTFRWKGENVSTNDVQETVSKCPGVKEANAYGVSVPDADGRAGMVAIVVEEGFDIQSLAAHVNEALPAYSRPLFVRIEDALQMTGSYKYVKTGLKRMGLTTKGQITALFSERRRILRALDEALYEKIVSHQIRV
ncbi:MAG: AMP-binding protein [Polyangiales bacterium]